MYGVVVICLDFKRKMFIVVWQFRLTKNITLVCQCFCKQMKKRTEVVLS